jgi:hypothetical protein
MWRLRGFLPCTFRHGLQPNASPENGTFRVKARRSVELNHMDMRLMLHMRVSMSARLEHTSHYVWFQKHGYQEQCAGAH